MDTSGPIDTAVVLEQVAAAVITLDRTGTILHANAAVAAMAGVPVAQLLGRPFDDVSFEAQDRLGQPLERERYPVARALLGEVVRAAELIVMAPDGSRLVLLASAVPLLDDRGEVEAVVATVQDVTGTSRWRDDYEASQARLSAVFTHAMEGMVLADDEGRYIAVNPAAARMLGYEPDELLGRRAAELVVTPYDQSQVFDDFVTAGQGQMELDMLRADGGTVTVEAVSVAHVEPGVHLSVWRDVTQRRRAELAMLDALERERMASDELERVASMRETFLSAVSHDLRTPLTAIVGFGTTLAEHGDVLAPERRADLAGRLLSNARRLMSLLDQLLDVNRVQRGAAVVRATPTSVRALADAAVAAVIELPGTSHRFEVIAPDTTVRLDVPKVERIIENLVANAARHTPQGTRVEIRITCEPREVTIEVEDDGPGIPEEFRAVAFDMFVRGDSGHARDAGTGVGLALVREFAELLGGSVELVDGRLGGALFRVRLPLEGPPPPQDREGRRPTDAP
jgi:PAS domain S-box-containing protein